MPQPMLPKILLVVAGTAVLAHAAPPEPGPAPAGAVAAPRPSMDPRAVTLRQLEKRITLEVTDAKLRDVVRFISEVTGARIEAAWRGDGADLGLDPERPTTLAVKDLPAIAVLERLLERTADDFGGNAWQMTESGEIEIGPKSVLNRTTTLKIYDVRDMLFQIPDFTNVPQLDLEQVLSQTGAGGGGGGGGGGVIEEFEPEASGPSERELAERLESIITANIESEQWTANGGDAATITLHDGALLVRAPDYIHRQLGGYPYWSGKGMRSLEAQEYRAALSAKERARLTGTAKGEDSPKPATVDPAQPSTP